MLRGNAMNTSGGFVRRAGLAGLLLGIVCLPGQVTTQGGSCGSLLSPALPGQVQAADLPPVEAPLWEGKAVGQSPGLQSVLPQAEVTIQERRTTGSPPSVCDPPPAPRSSFSSADPSVYYWVSAGGANQGDVVRWEWVRPNGSVYVSSQLTLAYSGGVCFWAGVTIAGQPPASSPGVWQVRLYYNGALLHTDSFTIVGLGGGGSGRLCTRNLQSFYVGALSLGFAAVRASCNVGQLLPPPTVALMVRDLTTAATGVNAMAPCIPFDTSRLIALAAKLGGLTGDQALREIELLYQELQQAIRQSGLTGDLGINASTFEQFYLAALNLGFAAARATCFPCQDPLPPAAVQQIQADLTAAQNGLRAFAACLPALDFAVFGTIRLGAPFTMLESYNDLAGLYSTVQSAVANSECCCTCPGGGACGTGTGTVTGTVRDASNGQPLGGATLAVANTTLTATSGSNGVFTLNNVPCGQQTLNASAGGYISTQAPITVAAGQTLTQNLSLSPVLQGGQVRMTLNWQPGSDGRPVDLDMHLSGPSPDGSSCFVISYTSLGNLDAAPFAKLEVDNVSIRPTTPPTETVRISRLTPGIYRLWIHDYRAEFPDGISRSRAAVQVFDSSGLKFNSTAPGGAGRYWSVLTMIGQTGAVTAVNQISGTSPSATPCR